MERPFTDRHAARRELAEVLAQYAGRDDVAVFGLPRGGIPVAYEVAHALGAPLDVLVVRKLGVPGHEELASEPAMHRRQTSAPLRGTDPYTSGVNVSVDIARVGRSDLGFGRAGAG